MRTVKELIKAHCLRLRQERPNGFTLDHDLCEPTEGYIVAYEETQGGTLDSAIDFALDHNTGVGYWNDGKNEYWDAVGIYENEFEAKLRSFIRGQIAYYDFSRNEVVPTPTFYWFFLHNSKYQYDVLFLSEIKTKIDKAKLIYKKEGAINNMQSIWGHTLESLLRDNELDFEKLSIFSNQIL